MKKVVLSFTVALMVLFLTTGVAAAQGQYSQGTIGVDIGWPNCTASVPSVTFGIVGVTDGQGLLNQSVYSERSQLF